MWHLLSHLPWDQIGGLFTAVGVMIGGLLRLWGSMKKMERERDRKRVVQLEAIRSSMQNVFDAHELLDKERHQDNLRKFEKVDDKLEYIGKALAALGWRNGTGHVQGG